jgi:hypothetical protein
MSMLPVPFNDDSGGFTSRQVAKARRAQASTSIAVYRHGLEAQALADMDRADSQAASDATRMSLEEELDLFDFGMSRVGGSAAKAELVARHVNRLSAINNRRLTRRFGG